MDLWSGLSSREGGWRGLCKCGEKTQEPNREAQQVSLYNRARPDSPKGNDRDSSCPHGLAFAELVKYTNNDEDMAPVFKQVDTAQIYKPLLKDPDLPEHSGWGWTKDTTGWQPLWATFAEASDSCHELIQSRSFSVPRNHPTNRSPPSPRPEPRRPRERSSPPRDPRRPPTSPPPAARTKSKAKRKEGREKIKVEV
uniref:Uncharacterized protein n=1 Tax=Timema cristinae TaxID=61476 RepID=A0A7R9H235_TIMCR|nr:unnamed protein product [Timema cristinae]